MKKDINYYMDLPWTYQIVYDPEDKSYFVQVAEIKYCMVDAPTPDEAMSLFRKVFKAHLQVMIDDGVEIPEPVSPEDFKGRITYRTSPSMHYKLAKLANARKLSISKLIDKLIESSVDAA